jgi:4a-hydroxytetrahydrobiopterin dehydratase
MNQQKRLQLLAGSCKPLPSGAPKLSPEQIAESLSAIPEWRLVNENSISRTYSCSSYMDGVRWFALAAALAESEDHHPDALVTWCKVTLTLWTHTVNGLSENDFILAAKFDRAWEEFLQGTLKPNAL